MLDFDDYPGLDISKYEAKLEQFLEEQERLKRKPKDHRGNSRKYIGHTRQSKAHRLQHE